MRSGGIRYKILINDTAVNGAAEGLANTAAEPPEPVAILNFIVRW